MPTTSKRPKLKKPISDPWRGEIAAGTIGTAAVVVYPEGALRGWGFLTSGGCTEYAINDKPDWFEWVDVCDECDKELCESQAIIGRDCPSYWITDEPVCHGHVEPAKPTPTVNDRDWEFSRLRRLQITLDEILRNWEATR